jgi:cytochrome P450
MPITQTPGLKSLPTTGAVTGLLEALAFFRDGSFAQRRFDQLGNVYETRLVGQPLVFIRGSKAIQGLLDNPDASEGWWPASVKQLLGSRSLANRNGPSHKARRRVVGQLFSAAALRRYNPCIVKLVNELAADLIATATPVALVERMRKFAFSVIAQVVLGLKEHDEQGLFMDFEIWTKALFSVPIAIPGSPFAKAMHARQRLLARLTQVLENARIDAAAGLPLAGGLDLLSDGIDEAGLPLSDADLVEQLLLLLFAGYETTASSLSCLMTMLLQHPQELAWLRQELNVLPWPNRSIQTSINYEANEAPRLAAVVQEVMRLNPPVGGFFRRTTRELILDGVVVPAGRVIQVALAASNRYQTDSNGLAVDQDDLEQFKPQRFIGEQIGVCLLPFGGGERVCLGKALAELEIRLMAVGLLKQLKLELLPEQNLTMQLVPSPSPKGGLVVKATAIS